MYVQEGAIGAGTGTVAFGWKGGIGTSSRKVVVGDASYTVGVLVQSNYGGTLVIDGVEVGSKLPDPATIRSEEHTSELQSLMRSSYAVFCLKKKNNTSATTN